MKVYKPAPIYKILLIGETHVGKTSLKIRFTEEKFLVDFKSTIGLDYKVKSVIINNQTFKISIWDTAGQEKYRSLVKSFYNNTHGIILCFDICDEKSFFEIKNYWIKEIQNYVNCKDEKCKIFLCGTKLDKKENRKILFQEAKRFADEMQIQYFETSAMKNLNIEEMFNHVVEDINKAQNFYITQEVIDSPNKNEILESSKINDSKFDKSSSNCCN